MKMIASTAVTFKVDNYNYDSTFHTAVLISITVFSGFADREKVSYTERTLMCFFFVAVTSTIQQMSTQIVATCIECRVIIIIIIRRRRREKEERRKEK